MAYVRRLPSGRWQATVRHPAGHKLTHTDPLKRSVQHWAATTEAALRNGAVAAQPGRGPTVAEWERRWTAARRVEPATAAKNRSHMRTHVLPRWGTWPMTSIGRLDVQAWVGDLTQAGAGPDTVSAAYRLLSTMLDDAVLDRHLTESPCRRIDLPRTVRPAPRWLTRHEYDRLQLALGDRPHAATWQAYLGLGAFSGLRPGELGGLDIPAVDFDRGHVRVQQVMTRHGLRDYGKTGAATRSVPFPAEVGNLLWAACADRASGPVFLTERGGRVDDTNFRSRVWVPALAAAGVEPVRPYVLRHTCASWLVQAGVPDRQIMAILGHSSSRLIAVYAHLAPDAHDAVRAAWGDTPMIQPVTVPIAQ